MSEKSLLCLPVQEPVLLHVAGSDERLPVGRVYCVGRNYAAHAREMGKDERDPPFFFMKPASAVVPVLGSGRIQMPSQTTDYQYEVELVAVIGKVAQSVPVDEALGHVWGYAIGLDMTRRDLQLQARDQGRPWEFGKSFSPSAPIGQVVRAAGQQPVGRITLKVGESVKQDDELSSMIWSVAECISQLSKFDRLLPGDVLMTGTPAGVGPVRVGERMRAVVAGLPPIEVLVTQGD